LCQYFKEVSMLDLNPIIARQVVQRFKLQVEILEQNFLDYKPDRPFDVAVAAAFLEHFPDPQAPVDQLRRILRPGGLAFIDVPTENIFYRVGRWLGRIEKPADHYQDAYTIVQTLSSRFTIRRIKALPNHLTPLFIQVIAEAR
jgi:SAM-dependent methyltransferase